MVVYLDCSLPSGLRFVYLYILGWRQGWGGGSLVGLILVLLGLSFDLLGSFVVVVVVVFFGGKKKRNTVNLSRKCTSYFFGILRTSNLVFSFCYLLLFCCHLLCQFSVCGGVLKHDQTARRFNLTKGSSVDLPGFPCHGGCMGRHCFLS